MAQYRIGVTEAGDAGLDLSWADRLCKVDSAVVITKCVSPKFREIVLANKDKLIVHATTTGYGGTILEPNVPSLDDEFDAVMALVQAGFPKEKIVIRVDPIIPTSKGIETAKKVIRLFMDSGFSRYRVSIIDMYPHARERFKQAGLRLPYGEFEFSPNTEQVKAVDKMLSDMLKYWQLLEYHNSSTLRIECCAEPELTNVIQCGCVSDYDLKLFGLTENNDVDNLGYQRPHCLCYSGKRELLRHRKRCGHGCLYCYWK